MIRIDLGKDGLDKKGRGKIPFNIQIPEKYRQYFEKIKVPGGTFDLRGTVLSLLLLALAFLPHLFVVQYEHYLTNQHLQAMKTLQEKEEELKQDIARFASFQKELESYEQQKKIVTERLAVVRRLLAQRNTPVNVLDAVGQSLPARTWLTDLEVNLGAKPQVTIKGKSYSNEEVSDFSDKLSESIHLSDVILGGVTTANNEDGIELKSFEINAMPKGIYASSAKSERDTASTQTGTTAASKADQSASKALDVKAGKAP